jgi:hypothetical protein
MTREEQEKLALADPTVQRILELSAEEIKQQQAALKEEFTKMSPHLLVSFWTLVAYREAAGSASEWLKALHPCYNMQLLKASDWLQANGYYTEKEGPSSTQYLLIDEV